MLQAGGEQRFAGAAWWQDAASRRPGRQEAQRSGQKPFLDFSLWAYKNNMHQDKGSRSRVCDRSRGGTAMLVGPDL